MKTRVNFEELENRIDFENVSNRLVTLAKNGGLKRKKTIADLLDKVKPALLQARENKVSFGALTEFLRESGIPVSEPTLRQYLRGEVAVKRKGKNKRESANIAPKAEPIAKASSEQNSTRKLPPRLARQTS